jgi:hypothetical protein
VQTSHGVWPVTLGNTRGPSVPLPFHPIAQAADFFTNSRATPKEKLILGGKLIWAASTLPGNWTPELLERANSIYRGLIRGGTLQKTVDQMDESAADACLRQVTKDTVELAAATVQIRSQGRPRR